MNRRTFVASSIVLPTVGAMSLTAFAQDHDHHKNHKSGKHNKTVQRKISKQENALLDSLAACTRTGEICIAHCIRLIANGEHQMVDCQKSVLNMVALAEALHGVVAYGTAEKEHVTSLVKTAQMFMANCEKECLKHAKYHAECRECAEACQSFEASAKAFLA